MHCALGTSVAIFLMSQKSGTAVHVGSYVSLAANKVLRKFIRWFSSKSKIILYRQKGNKANALTYKNNDCKVKDITSL